jgi:hypothetical protein
MREFCSQPDARYRHREPPPPLADWHRQRRSDLAALKRGAEPPSAPKEHVACYTRTWVIIAPAVSMRMPGFRGKQVLLERAVHKGHHSLRTCLKRTIRRRRHANILETNYL